MARLLLTLSALFLINVAAQSTITTTTTLSTAPPTTSSASIPPFGNDPLTPCVLGCIQPAASANGCSYTDPSCVCVSAQFLADARACLQAQCTPEDLRAALALQAQQCSLLGLSVMGSATSTATTSASATPTTPISGARPASTTSTGSPMRTNAAVSRGTGLWGWGWAVAGAVAVVAV